MVGQCIYMSKHEEPIPAFPKGQEAAMGNMYGYVRVSTREQNEERQMIAMSQVKVPEKNIYMDKQSGKDFERPMYHRMVGRLQEDDLLYIKSIDRLGRNFNEILEQWRHITLEKKCGIIVLDMDILNTDVDRGLLDRLVSEIMMIALSYVAQTEREMMRQRVFEGIAAAKEKGVHCGRKPMEVPSFFEMIYDMWKKERISGREAARQLGVDNHTFKKWISLMEEAV